MILLNGMKYLAFDIEAANGYLPSSICSVGVVIADENFHVLHKENIWINPKCKYNLNGTRPNVGIDLHLDSEQIKRSPDFKATYPRLKALLTDPQTIVIGHAVDSDVHMLNEACKRYRLPSIDFTYYCTQLLFRMFKGEKNVRGLDKIAAEIGVQFEQHRSDEDAWVSLRTLQYLIEQTGCNWPGLLEKYAIRAGRNRNYERTCTVSLLGQIGKKTLLRQAKLRTEEILKGLTPARGGIWQGKNVSVSRGLECGEEEQIREILTQIYRLGGTYTAKIGKSDFYITEANHKDMDKNRMQYLRKLAESGKEIHILDYADFQNLAESGTQRKEGE